MAISCAPLRGGPPTETAIVGWVHAGEEPAQRAYVRLLKPDGEFASEVRCDPTGAFRLAAMPGRWEVVCLAPHGVRLAQPLTLARGDHFEVTFRLAS
ncbi:MAG TPA: DUF1416 domain-containing protein [Candidatus Dormibacteraeota bacterium]|jgi:hypothetical protein|nr:DUF1416 domain-containing protein [Candidatus Dormibacteraeota bacterium]